MRASNTVTRMTGSFAAAIFSAICYGVGTALQAAGVRRRRRAPFVIGVVLDLLGFAAQLVALRGLPLFVVQAAQAGNLAVTALACVPLLGIRLGARHWAAVLGVCAGLALLGAASGAEGAAGATLTTRYWLLAAALLLGAAALLAARLKPPSGPIIQGIVAGLGFGLTAISVRAMPGLVPTSLVRDPAAYAAAVSGACAFLSFAAGLQRGAVTTVSALVIIGETALPAAAGIALWHDRTRPGWTVPAVLGFAFAVAGALTLARFAEPGEPNTATPDTTRPNPAAPDTTRPDSGRPDSGRPDSARPDSGEPKPAGLKAAEPKAVELKAAEPEADRGDGPVTPIG